MIRRAAPGIFLAGAFLWFCQGCAPKIVQVQLGPPPGWVDDMPKHSGKLCALGYSGPTFYQEDCLKNAADNARGHLSESISVTIKTMTVDISDGTRGSYDQDVFVEGSQSASETVLKGSEVESQWMDREGQRGAENGCFCLVCIDPNKPIDTLVQTLQDKKLPPKTVEKVRANAQAAFDELEKQEAKVQSKPVVPTPKPEGKKPEPPPDNNQKEQQPPPAGNQPAPGSQPPPPAPNQLQYR